MASPYAPPTTTLKPDGVRARTAHAWIAFVSGFFGVPAIIVGILVAFDQPLSVLTHTFPAILRPIGFFIAGAVFAALVVLPFRKLRWYWAAIVGPLLSFVVLAGAVFAYEYLMEMFHDPEV